MSVTFFDPGKIKRATAFLSYMHLVWLKKEEMNCNVLRPSPLNEVEASYIG